MFNTKSAQTCLAYTNEYGIQKYKKACTKNVWTVETNMSCRNMYGRQKYVSPAEDICPLTTQGYALQKQV